MSTYKKIIIRKAISDAMQTAAEILGIILECAALIGIIALTI